MVENCAYLLPNIDVRLMKVAIETGLFLNLLKIKPNLSSFIHLSSSRCHLMVVKVLIRSIELAVYEREPWAV